MRYSVDQQAVFSIPWPSERQIWALAVLTYGILDPALTYSVLQLGGVESMSMAVWFLETFGSAGLGIQKVLIFGVFGVFAYVLTLIAKVVDQPASPYRAVVAIVVSVRGLQLFVNHVENLQVLL